ncbi:hypothetical protein SAMN05421638_1441 [Kaistella treverensis]|uniref:Uncharacterized protein n=1 Tax=Kaistella treverensis TaxID=631455 RepID=A0A1I3LZS8_9FLAO|nr:hypothetical protein [Kaistella treverensis]SFI90222.1 hypothetical protein SAMN05421638_1441 [Kaistella treverensis]
MIHDKDYIIRIVKQFSEFLSKLLLEKNEGELPEQERIFDTNMNDTFKMDFETLSAKSTDEIIELIEAKDSSHHIPYYELLGHLFYFKNKENTNGNFAAKAQKFYELYLQKSGVFSLPIVSRINELKKSV